MVDIGGQTTELGLFHLGKCIASTTILVGGDHYTEAVVKLLRDEYQCVIGWPTAETLKLQYQKLITAHNRANRAGEYKLVVRGKDVVSGVPTTVSVSSSLLNTRFTRITENLITEMKTYMAQLSSELLTSTLENGLHVSGGGSLLPGLSDHLSQELKSHFTLSQSPQEDLIKGLRILNRS